jgi:hypothetical protein
MKTEDSLELKVKSLWLTVLVKLEILPERSVGRPAKMQ